MRPLRVLAACALPAVLAGCGSATSTSAACAPSATPVVTPPTAAAGHVLVASDRGLVVAGDTVTFDVRLIGPVTASVACAGPVQLVVVDRANLHVFADAPPASRQTACGSVSVAAGSTADYSVAWTPDPTLPSGTYTAVLSIGILDPVTVPVVLARRAAESC